MTVTDEGRWHPRAASPCPPPDQPTEATVAGEPGAGRDELVRALSGSALLRVRVAPAVRPVPARPGAGRPPRPVRPAVLVLRSARPARDVRDRLAAGEAAPILVVSAEAAEDEVVRTVQGGATSYLVDGQYGPGDVLAAALGTAAGRSHLSPSALAAVVRRLQHPDRLGVPSALAAALSRRERQIMELVAEGHPNSHIARREFIAEKTVRNHLNSIYAKLGVRSRAEAILVWLGRTRPAG